MVLEIEGKAGVPGSAWARSHMPIIRLQPGQAPATPSELSVVAPTIPDVGAVTPGSPRSVTSQLSYSGVSSRYCECCARKLPLEGRARVVADRAGDVVGGEGPEVRMGGVDALVDQADVGVADDPVPGIDEIELG